MNVLVIAAHPDDEALGCGGTIARHVDDGDDVASVFMTDGVGARENADNDSAARTRRYAAKASANILGIGRTEFLSFPDNRMDTVPLLSVVQELEHVIAETKPSTIYTHHGGDLNVDHRITFQAALTACRPQPGASVRNFICFETVSSSEWSAATIGPAFEPNTFVDISTHLDQKLGALRAYENEMRAAPHSRSFAAVESLARWRGSTVGVAAAEAFFTVRSIL